MFYLICWFPSYLLICEFFSKISILQMSSHSTYECKLNKSIHVCISNTFTKHNVLPEEAYLSEHTVKHENAHAVKQMTEMNWGHFSVLHISTVFYLTKRLSNQTERKAIFHLFTLQYWVTSCPGKTSFYSSPELLAHYFFFCGWGEGGRIVQLKNYVY